MFLVLILLNQFFCLAQPLEQGNSLNYALENLESQTSHESKSLDRAFLISDNSRSGISRKDYAPCLDYFLSALDSNRLILNYKALSHGSFDMSMSGTLDMQGNLYKLDAKAFKIYSNAKQTWILDYSSHEAIMQENSDEEDLSSISQTLISNPILILHNIKDFFSLDKGVAPDHSQGNNATAAAQAQTNAGKAEQSQTKATKANQSQGNATAANQSQANAGRAEQYQGNATKAVKTNSHSSNTEQEFKFKAIKTGLGIDELSLYFRNDRLVKLLLREDKSKTITIDVISYKFVKKIADSNYDFNPASLSKDWNITEL